MTGRRALLAVFGGRRARRAPATDAVPGPGMVDPATIQVFAHTLIADLFAAGLRLQNLARSAPEELQGELEEIAGQIDTVISDARNFAFTCREQPEAE